MRVFHDLKEVRVPLMVENLRVEYLTVEARDGNVYFKVPIVDGSDTHTEIHLPPDVAADLAKHIRFVAAHAGEEFAPGEEEIWNES